MSRHTESRLSGSPSHGSLLENVRPFTPNWFAVTMGTGAAYLVLNALPAQFACKASIAQSLWVVDVGLYTIFFLMFAGRFILFGETIELLLRHPLQSMFLGALPMGLAPIINGCVAFAGPRIGEPAYQLAMNLWMFDAALSVLIAVGVPYFVFTRQEHSLDRLTAALLLPIVAPEVAASSAGVLAPHLPTLTAQLVVGTGCLACLSPATGANTTSSPASTSMRSRAVASISPSLSSWMNFGRCEKYLGSSSPRPARDTNAAWPDFYACWNIWPLLLFV